MNRRNMNWRAIGEAIAAISIVISLIFVGWEVRQSSEVARMEAYQSFSVAVSENARAIYNDPQFADLLDKTNQDLVPATELSGSQFLQIQSYFISVLHLYQGLFRSIQAGIISDEFMPVIIEDPQLHTANFRSIWPGLRVFFTDPFIEFMEEEVLGN